MKTLVVNLLGGPGAKKSTTACQLFAALKHAGINCELVTEYAKDKVWEKSTSVLDDQLYVFAKQNHRQRILVGEVDVIITDSSLLNSIIYGKDKVKGFDALVTEVYDTYNNLNVFINRVKAFNPKGRVQNEQEAIELDKRIKDLLDHTGLEYVEVFGDELAATQLYDIVTTYLFEPVGQRGKEKSIALKE